MTSCPLEQLFTPKNFVTACADLNIHLIDAGNAPLVMEAIGKIREQEFQREGGGTGKNSDIDSFDTHSPAYRQLVAWDPKSYEIVAVYRFICGNWVNPKKYHMQLASAEFFEFSPDFVSNYLPLIIELGRSVVNRSSKRRNRGLFAIWAGLGALVHEYPETRYFFGKFTMHSRLPEGIRDAICGLFKSWRQGDEKLVRPRPPYQIERNGNWQKGSSFREDLSRLIRLAAASKTYIPPLILTYAKLSEHLQFFGTARNHAFGNSEESAILVPIRNIYPKIRENFINSYTSVNPELFY